MKIARCSLASCLSWAVAFTPLVSATEPLSTIVVTSERLGQQDIQHTPQAVSVTGSEDLRAADATVLQDLARSSPGLNISSYNPGQSTPYIRGIGSNEDGAGGDPSVGVFLDEVYLGRSAAWAADLFGLERVEVLRGPQGVLYGRNVLGGAVNLVTRRPGEERISTIDTTLGNLDYRKVHFEFSGPLGDEIYAGISGVIDRRDGYLESVTTDHQHLDRDR